MSGQVAATKLMARTLCRMHVGCTSPMHMPKLHQSCRLAACLWAGQKGDSIRHLVFPQRRAEWGVAAGCICRETWGARGLNGSHLGSGIRGGGHAATPSSLLARYSAAQATRLLSKLSEACAKGKAHHRRWQLATFEANINTAGAQ
jgi:hypothetical protein